MVEYKDRLADALGTLSVQKLADKLGVSYQAVKKVLAGTSGAFSAPNNTKAAEFLGVSSDWLAVGAPYKKERDAAPSAWPFKVISEQKVRDLSDEGRARLEGAIAVASAQIGIDVRADEETAQQVEGQPQFPETSAQTHNLSQTLDKELQELARDGRAEGRQRRRPK